MILNEFVNNSLDTKHSVDFSLVNDISGNPFEYMVGAAYECNIIEQKINMYAICEEYSYLKEYGEVQPIHEANIIITIFTAIKNAIVSVFKKICEFFKSIFSKAEETTTEIKKNTETINKKKDQQIKNPKEIDISYYEIDDLDDIAKQLPEIPNELIEYVKPAIVSIYASIGMELSRGTAEDRKAIIDHMKDDKEFNMIKGFIECLKNEGITKTLSYMGASVPKDVITIVDAIENNKVQLTDSPHHEVQIHDAATVGDAVKQIRSGINSVTKVKGWLDGAFNLAKKAISVAKETVDASEKRVIAILNNSAAKRGDKSLSDVTQCVQELTQMLNSAITIIDNTLIKIQTATTKLIMTQLAQYNDAVKKISELHLIEQKG